MPEGAHLVHMLPEVPKAQDCATDARRSAEAPSVESASKRRKTVPPGEDGGGGGNCSSRACRGKPTDEKLLLLRAPVLHLYLAAASKGLRGVRFGVDERNRPTACSVVAALSGVVDSHALFHIQGNAAVEGSVGAADDVERPLTGVAHWWPLDSVASLPRSGSPLSPKVRVVDGMLLSSKLLRIGRHPEFAAGSITSGNGGIETLPSDWCSRRGPDVLSA